MMRVFLALGVFLLAGCPTTKFECDEETPCPQVGEVCQLGECVEARCANSSQCPMESYCSAGDCVLGCSEEDDCYPGSTCDFETNQCVEDACTDTLTDCGYRQFCNTATGDCYDAGDQYCKFCDEDYECGEGNYCFAHYCGVNCASGQECPSGFECLPLADNNGNIVTWQCLTYCWLYEDYDPGSFAKAPPADVVLQSLPDGTTTLVTP